MASWKEDEKNERIICGLLKLPENSRCINCNSLGPQYVCTNFWMFVCTNCSGIHREFTHQVKSISMAKFTSQEVKSLQEGGNQRAKEIYQKELDPQRNSFPDCSNVERLRDFIKDVYVDRRYTCERNSDKPPSLKVGDKEDSYEIRRQDSYQGSRSPPYDDGRGDRSSPGGRSYEAQRSPGYQQESRQYGDSKKSRPCPEIVNDWRLEDKFGNGRRYDRVSDRDSKLDVKSADRSSDIDNNWSSFDVAPHMKASHAPPNANSLESLLSQLSVSAPVPSYSGTSDNTGGFTAAGNMTAPFGGNSVILPVGAPVVIPGLAQVFPANVSYASATGSGQWTSMQHQQPSLFPSNRIQSASQQYIRSAGEASSNHPWNSAQDRPSFPTAQAPQDVSTSNHTVSTVASQQSAGDVKSIGRSALPELHGTTNVGLNGKNFMVLAADKRLSDEIGWRFVVANDNDLKVYVISSFSNIHTTSAGNAALWDIMYEYVTSVVDVEEKRTRNCVSVDFVKKAIGAFCAASRLRYRYGGILAGWPKGGVREMCCYAINETPLNRKPRFFDIFPEGSSSKIDSNFGVTGSGAVEAGRYLWKKQNQPLKDKNDGVRRVLGAIFQSSLKDRYSGGGAKVVIVEEGSFDTPNSFDTIDLHSMFIDEDAVVYLFAPVGVSLSAWDIRSAWGWLKILHIYCVIKTRGFTFYRVALLNNAEVSRAKSRLFIQEPNISENYSSPADFISSITPVMIHDRRCHASAKSEFILGWVHRFMKEEQAEEKKKENEKC